MRTGLCCPQDGFWFSSPFECRVQPEASFRCSNTAKEDVRLRRNVVGKRQEHGIPSTQPQDRWYLTHRVDQMRKQSVCVCVQTCGNQSNPAFGLSEKGVRCLLLNYGFFCNFVCFAMQTYVLLNYLYFSYNCVRSIICTSTTKSCYLVSTRI